MKKFILILAIVLVTGGGIVGSTISNNSHKQTNIVQTENQISYKGFDGKDALTLLKDKYKVSTKTYVGMGEMVESINDTKPNSKQFWAFYVNGKSSQTGASSYITKSSDNLSWKLETF